MGKKRRILTRSTKFAKKYFEFLDKADGSDDDVIDDGDTYIDTISATDNEDETVTVSGRILGGGHTTGNVEISVNGGAFTDATAATAAGSGLDKVQYSVTTATDAPLGKGTHTIRVRKQNETNESLYKSVTVDVRENRISIQSSAFVGNDGTDQIVFTKANLFAADPGKKKAGDPDNAALGDNGINIVVSKDGAANDATLLAAAFDAGQDGTISAAELDSLAATINILDAAAEGVYTFTVTPLDSEATALADSAITFDVTVA